MNRPRPSVSSRIVTLALGGFVSLCANVAFAAPAVAPAPAPATTTTTTEARAADGNPVIVVNNTVASTPAPAPAPAVVAPAPAPVVATPAPTTVATVPATVTMPAQVQVAMTPQTMAAPSKAELARLRKVAEVNRARSLRNAGWATLGSVYGVSALIGTITIDSTSPGRMRNYGYSMVIPVAGPFIAAFHSRSATGALLTTTLGVAQAVGLGMAIVGGARHRRFKRDLTFAAAPTRGGGQVGVSMRF
ncbi:MAG: hypothetical protein AAF799_17375 [Myxococcota bacterium]